MAIRVHVLTKFLFWQTSVTIEIVVKQDMRKAEAVWRHLTFSILMTEADSYCFVSLMLLVDPELPFMLYRLGGSRHAGY